jgi:hypothetical protein
MCFSIEGQVCVLKQFITQGGEYVREINAMCESCFTIMKSLVQKYRQLVYNRVL